MLVIVFTFSFLVIASVTGFIFYGFLKEFKASVDELEKNPEFSDFEINNKAG